MSIKDLFIDLLYKSVQQFFILLWKWGLWFIVLFLSVLGRVFYEILSHPDIKIWKLILIAGLGGTVGLLALIICITRGIGLVGLIIVVIAVLVSYRIIDYIVNINLKDIVREAVKDTIDKLIKK